MSAFVGQEMASGESPGSGSRGLDQEQGLEPGPDAPPFRTWKRNERLVYLTNFVHMTMYTMCFGGIFDIFLYHLSQNQQVLVTNSITVGGGHSAVPSVLSVNTHSEFELTFEIKPGLQALYPSNSSCWQTFTCAGPREVAPKGEGKGQLKGKKGKDLLAVEAEEVPVKKAVLPKDSVDVRIEIASIKNCGTAGLAKSSEAAKFAWLAQVSYTGAKADTIRRRFLTILTSTLGEPLHLRMRFFSHFGCTPAGLRSQLSLRVGDRVCVTQVAAHGWVFGYRILAGPGGNREGWFPTFCLPESRQVPPAPRPQQSPPPSAPPVGSTQVARDYEANDTAQLSVKAGELVFIRQKDSTGWTFVVKVNPQAVGQREGWVPDWLVEK
ncbi:unnamed protein product [Polarella glacialis]|uniref:SH3 domain-containing protein n=1 Tax=Polarella glacialis TaxID=89957 RepID=A0A813GKW1_POLGL|nr:unnamed protein product [Polarella glacialis]